MLVISIVWTFVFLSSMRGLTFRESNKRGPRMSESLRESAGGSLSLCPEWEHAPGKPQLSPVCCVERICKRPLRLLRPCMLCKRKTQCDAMMLWTVRGRLLVCRSRLVRCPIGAAVDYWEEAAGRSALKT